MLGICLGLAGAIWAEIPIADFTLAWRHSVEKERWEEDYRVTPAGLVLGEARIKGSGAGMEIPDGAELRDGSWHYRPALPPLESLHLARTREASDYALCFHGRCRSMGEWLGPPSQNQPAVDLWGCRQSSGRGEPARLPIDPSPVIPMKTSQSSRDSSLIDDFAGEDGLSRIGTPWRLVADGVMGGVSTGRMKLELVDGRRALCLSGLVSLENNGGFVQINLDLAPRESFDASGFVGVRLLARGNGERYGVHLKTSDTGLPWQSYRAGFTAGPEWREERLPFAAFVPHRVESALDTRGLRRLGIVAIGKTMQADLCVAEVGFYRSRAVR